MRLYKFLISRLTDPGRSYEERTLSMLAILSFFELIIALLFDVLVGENTVEIITLVGMAAAVPIVTGLSVHFRKVFLGSLIQVLSLVFVVLPVTFFFGGGPKGGGVFWVVFSYMFIGMSLSGKLRMVMMAWVTLQTMASYAVWLLRPELVHAHSNQTFGLDALVSVLLVGTSAFGMLTYQKYLFRSESLRAKAETRRVEELNRSQSRFFSSMSHEIRTPINSILGLNEIILRQDGISEEIIRDARNIQGSGKMLLALINDILDVSKIEAGKMEIIPVEYKTAELMSEVVNMIWMKAEDKGLAFRVEVDPSTPSQMYGDEVRIKQILINLLNNAVKYTEHGSISLHMECENTDADHPDQVMLRITVSDTGMGIKRESLPYLFDSFRRVDEEKNRRIEGTGLGLSIVKQLVDMMSGEVSVSSVYTKGATFVVSLPQLIVDEEPIGNLNIGGEGDYSYHFEHSFTAPDARVMIVDDNAINREVEKKLLDGTHIQVDLAASGAEALEKTLAYSYDVIFMDHLMPEMDGIECLKEIRGQVGGLNRDVPVLVFTANAGSENIDLYNAAGFDGYLLKPASGAQIAEKLLLHLPAVKIIRRETDELVRQEISTARGYRKKKVVVITASSMSDIPEILVRELDLHIIPFSIITKEGVFMDSVEMDADELIRYAGDDPTTIESKAPTIAEFIDFFAMELERAHHIIHIAITGGMSNEYRYATEAAEVFGDVTVVDSDALSSATGILTLCACQMAKQNEPVNRILEELEKVKERLHTSFILSKTEFMLKRGFISPALNSIIEALSLRISVEVGEDSFGVDRIWFGSRRDCFKHYIRHALPKGARPDNDVLFVTYVGMSEEDLEWIENKIRKYSNFDHIIFQKASAAISVNCGPGTFGLLYMGKGKRNFNIGALLPRELEESNAVQTGENLSAAMPFSEIIKAPRTVSDADLFIEAEKKDDNEEKKWYDNIPGLDGHFAMQNSGSEESLRTVIRIYYESIEEKRRALWDYYNNEDWENYIIKIHALKSSSRLIGILGIGAEAESLEMAGKKGDYDFIRQNHKMVMEDYSAFKEILAPVFETKEEEADRPKADEKLMHSVYEMLLEACEDMDNDAIEEVLEEIDGYEIPEEESEKFEKIKDCYRSFDYEGIILLLKGNEE